MCGQGSDRSSTCNPGFARDRDIERLHLAIESKVLDGDSGSGARIRCRPVAVWNQA